MAAPGTTTATGSAGERVSHIQYYGFQMVYTYDQPEFVHRCKGKLSLKVISISKYYISSISGSRDISSLSPGQAACPEPSITTRGRSPGTARAVSTGAPPSSWPTLPGTTRRRQLMVSGFSSMRHSWLSQQLRKIFP